MDQSMVIDVAQQSIMVAIMLSAPVLGIGLLLGLIVSIIQATTQIQEASLSFIPKLIGIAVTLLIFGPWMMTVMSEFTIKLFENIPKYIR